MDLTEGARLLQAFRQGPPLRSQVELAELFATSQQNVSGWLSGRIRPGLVHQLKLQAIAGIPIPAWLTASERASLGPIANVGTGSVVRRHRRRYRGRVTHAQVTR